MDDAARARFRREIAALEGLAHPHLVAMIDHGVDAELGPYLVLPLLAGTTLRELVGNRAICPEAALLLIQPIALATAALHAAGYVHRDLKPENVIAGPDGAVTVIDLGLAWREGMTRHTDTGAAVGSVGYMAPEQIEGRTVDTRADVWSLGVMLYEWIAGKRPFARARAAEEAAANARAAVSPPTKPPPIALWPRSRMSTEATASSQTKSRLVIARMKTVRPPGAGATSSRAVRGPSSDQATIAESARTAVSPSVSKPRKSTRMTLTTLRPPPSL